MSLKVEEDDTVNSVNVKLEHAEMGTGGDIKTKSDTENKKREYLINANKRLREGIAEFNERQEKVLEFLEVEYEEGFQRLSNNKKRLKFVLDITDNDLVDGRRSEKYKHMIKLLKLGNAYWKQQRSQIHRPSNTDSRLRYENNVPPELAALRLSINFDSGLFTRKPVKRCHKCYDESHEMKFCPYKHVESRTPEVTAMIEARFEKLKQQEGSDPLLSKAYKSKHYKIKDVKKFPKKEKRAQ